ncbi:MAG TPA: hypothetical protein VIO62_12645 [Candidatus Dormibacteraeota bacterium]|jgi:hypothetical protein
MYRRIRRVLWRLGLIKLELERERCWREISEITVRLAPSLVPNDSRPRRQRSG